MTAHHRKLNEEVTAIEAAIPDVFLPGDTESLLLNGSSDFPQATLTCWCFYANRVKNKNSVKGVTDPDYHEYIGLQFHSGGEKS